MDSRPGRAMILTLIIGLAAVNVLALRVPASSSSGEDAQLFGGQAQDLTLGDRSSSGGPRMSPDATTVEVVYFDYLDEEGTLSGGRMLLTVPLLPSSPIYVELAEGSVASLFVNGPSTNRIDIVFLGDGYTASELGSYASDVDALAGYLFAAEPFAAYQTAFNAYRVDVVSNESGIDHDPTFGIYRDTALDTGLWCNGIEHALCVDTFKASAYAAAAPDADWIVVVANSTQYGGSFHIGTVVVTGGNEYSPEILVHEMGHYSVGDEYDYADGAVYSGSEPNWPNVSVLDADQMAVSGTKWARWLGTNDSLYGGLVSAYEGAMYYEFGVYRPTADSIMRNVITPYFNLPSIEALVLDFYRTVISPVEGSSPLVADYAGNEQLFVNPLPGIGSLSVQWSLEGTPIPGATAPLLDLSTISAPPGEYTVSVTVTDGTSFVRDQAARDASMTEELQFKIRSAPSWPPGTALRASAVSQHGLTLSWSEAVDNVGVTGYKLFQDDALLVSVPVSTLSWDVAGLDPATTYSFRVEAVDAAGFWSIDGPELTTTTVPPRLPAEHGVGLVDPSQGFWRLRDPDGTVNSFFYGNPGDVPFMGDWDCDGDDTPGLFRASDAFAYLRNSNTQGNADIRFFFGNPSDIPLAGDFNGDGCNTLSIYRPSEQRFYIINRLGENEGGLGAADYSFLFGNPGDSPVVGDWDGDGIDEIGLHRESSGFFYWRNTLTTGIADGEIFFGNPADRFVAGDWGIVDGKDTPAVFRPGNATYYFRHTLTQGAADSQFTWGQQPWLPIAGRFSLG